MRFLDREDAGRQLAQPCLPFAAEAPVVLGLPRGGVPVAFEVARALAAPLDVWVVRKVGAPGFPELGLGAVAEGGVLVLNPDVMADVGVTEEDLQDDVREQRAEVDARVARFRRGRPPPALAGRTVLLVDDGIATGGTVRAAVQALRAVGVGRLVLAVPVAASQTLETLEPLVDDVVCLHATPWLHAIGAWYDDFAQVADAEVVQLLERARTSAGAPVSGAPPATPAPARGRERAVQLSLGALTLQGTLAVPAGARGLVLFAHGSGSSRLSPRNRQVAGVLRRHHLGTLLFDLLTREEEASDAAGGTLRFDIPLLATRLAAATRWVRADAELSGLALGYFGSSTGAAAALVAAAAAPELIRAVVSRGGRPDLAGESLGRVRAPTLLVVGGDDTEVLALNHAALAQLGAPAQLAVVPGATHLFEEPGALDAVAQLAAEWFEHHLAAESELQPAPAAQDASPAG